MFKLNIEKAREIHRNNIRIARKPVLEQKDIEYMRAVERADVDTQKLVAEEKQKLRDATQTPEINRAKTLEDLKNSWDESLLGENPYKQQ